ncbi:MAG TPA: SatD family protein [Mobilitalea sp.]|nr:SatD family protein [Mobilitalea sp.]
MYYAMIGDIIHSKEINHKLRNDVQNNLKLILEGINQRYSEDIAAKFIITIGDEFQGLLHRPFNLLKIIDEIQFKMYPVRMRFGVGFGEIDTEINKEMALGADGPAYHYARDIIEQIKVSEKGKQSGNANILFKSGREEHHMLLELMNSGLQLCSFIEGKWTDKQRILIDKMKYLGMNQTEAAKELCIAQSSVQRRLKSAGYYDYYSARELISQILNKL